MGHDGLKDATVKRTQLVILSVDPLNLMQSGSALKLNSQTT